MEEGLRFTKHHIELSYILECYILEKHKLSINLRHVNRCLKNKLTMAIYLFIFFLGGGMFRY